MIKTLLSQPLHKLSRLSWEVGFFIVLISLVGWILLISAGNGDFHIWASKQVIRFCIGLLMMVFIALIDLRWLSQFSYIIYGIAIVLLCGVEFLGSIGKGAERWIDLYIIQLQPSELMKIGVVMALARYFHSQSYPLPLHKFFIPLLLVCMPVLLVLKQPDLGTALVLLMTGGAIFFLAGLRIWVFVVALISAVSSVPILWSFLHDYQKKRIWMFFDPSQDAKGAGYHIIQSKIALGSGGLWGKGFMQGTQASLNFLPEKQTDFIFTLLCEEWGFAGGVFLIILYVFLLLACSRIILTTQNDFGRFVAAGITITFFLYFFINIAMVMGLLPVVGIPLPLVSFGGTALLTLLMGFGLILNVGLHRNQKLSRVSVGIL